MYVDNFSIKSLSAPVANTFGLMNQGMFINTSPYWRLEDTVRYYLRADTAPYIQIDSAKTVVSGSAYMYDVVFNNALSGNYYIVVKHRNSIETWSNLPVTYTRGSTFFKNFISPGESYGDNMPLMIQSETWRGLYSGDINQDGAIDASDVSLVETDASNFVSGYVITDLTGDNFVDGSDFSFADNNAANYVEAVRPPGANVPAPSYYSNELPATQVSESVLEKIANGKRFREMQKQETVKPKLSYKEYLKELKEKYKDQ